MKKTQPNYFHLKILTKASIGAKLVFLFFILVIYNVQANSMNSIKDEIPKNGDHISEKSVAIVVMNEAYFFQQTVTGQVLDQNNQPLPGASVVEKGTPNGTQTDFDGNFSLEVDSGAVLEE